jgi:hypothetical protein
MRESLPSGRWPTEWNINGVKCEKSKEVEISLSPSPFEGPEVQKVVMVERKE